MNLSFMKKCVPNVNVRRTTTTITIDATRRNGWTLKSFACCSTITKFPMTYFIFQRYLKRYNRNFPIMIHIRNKIIRFQVVAQKMFFLEAIWLFFVDLKYVTHFYIEQIFPLSRFIYFFSFVVFRKKSLNSYNWFHCNASNVFWVIRFLLLQFLCLSMSLFFLSLIFQNLGHNVSIWNVELFAEWHTSCAEATKCNWCSA